MKTLKLFTLCAISSALVACGSDSVDNTLGSVTLSGTPLEGETLTATVEDADGVEQSSIIYRWLVNGDQIEGATSSTYTLTADEGGAQVYVSVVYTDGTGLREAHTSTPTEEVEALAVNSPGQITINGSSTVGQTLTASITDDNNVSGTITYSWAASGVVIDGAIAATYELTDNELGDTITATASYTDDDEFVEQITSLPTAAVVSAATNTPATLEIQSSTELTVGQSVVATLVDPNGTSNAVFEWRADGAVITDANTSTYTPVAGDLGKTLSVATTFTDDDGFDESVNTEAAGMVHSLIVSGLADLVAATSTVADGDIVGLASGDYTSADLPANEINFATDNLKFVMTTDSTAVISGNLCMQFSGSGITVDGLSFQDINLLTGSACAGNGPSAIYLSGDNVVFMNNTITDEASGHGLGDFSWVAVKGFSNTIIRNAFSDSTDQKVQTKGAVITIYNNSDADSQESHTISYNLFKDFGPAGPDDGGIRNSSSYMIQVGRSTGSSSQEDGLNTVEFNLFKNVNLDRRYMRVQSGNNLIRNNTFLDGSGMIALEDGNSNTVTNNIIINTVGDNPDDGGISYGPYGHTITNNYIAGLRTTSGDRAGIYASSDVLDGSGNKTATVATVTVANNTLINNREAIEFASKDCLDSDNPDAFLVDFDDNLVANGETGALTGNENNGSGREAIQDDCTIDSASDFDGNHIYSNTFTNSGADFFSLFAGSSANIIGTEGSADLVAGNDGLLQGQNTDAGKGADVSLLSLLSEQDVGPASAR